MEGELRFSRKSNSPPGIQPSAASQRQDSPDPKGGTGGALLRRLCSGWFLGCRCRLEGRKWFRHSHEQEVPWRDRPARGIEREDLVSNANRWTILGTKPLAVGERSYRLPCHWNRRWISVLPFRFTPRKPSLHQAGSPCATSPCCSRLITREMAVRSDLDIVIIAPSTCRVHEHQEPLCPPEGKLERAGCAVL